MSKSERTQALIKADIQHILHPISNPGSHMGVVFEETHDRIYLVDTEGKTYIDVTSGLMCVNLGHGQKPIQDAVCEAIRKIDYTTSFYGFGNVYAIECAGLLSDITPGDLDHYYFVSGGSEATDTAVKIARLYWHYKGMGTKQKIINLYNSYHGQTGISTYTSRMLQGMLQRGFGAEPGGFLRVPGFYCYRCQFGESHPGCNTLCARYLKSVIDSEGADSIAAFFAEPIQGSGGVIEPPPEYWPLVRKICTENDILLIDDEVMSGFARTGRMFAIEHYGVVPDMMTMAKGITSAYLPLGAVAFSDEILETLKDKLFIHGVTYSGHPIPCAASVAALKLYQEQNVVENAAMVGGHIKKRLDEEFLPLPCVGNIGGGKGMFHAVELVSDKDSKAILEPAIRHALWSKMLENGLFGRITGAFGNRLFIAPPCTMTVEEADLTLDTLLPLVSELKPE
jgi:adenosylmethionine-8-amino-7-oxononanoate aminotransferase